MKMSICVVKRLILAKGTDRMENSRDLKLLE